MIYSTWLGTESLPTELFICDICLRLAEDKHVLSKRFMKKIIIAIENLYDIYGSDI